MLGNLSKIGNASIFGSKGSLQPVATVQTHLLRSDKKPDIRDETLECLDVRANASRELLDQRFGHHKLNLCFGHLSELPL